MTDPKPILQLLLEHSDGVQAIACFLLCLVLIVAIVFVVRYCSQAVHYISEKNAASLNKLADKISKNDETNNNILFEMKEMRKDYNKTKKG